MTMELLNERVEITKYGPLYQLIH